MKLFGLSIFEKVNNKIIIRTVQPSTTPVAKIPYIGVNSLSYAQQFSGGRGYFIGGEYDLSEIGKIEDSVSGNRLTVAKVDGEIRTFTFSQLWNWATTQYTAQLDQNDIERIYIDDNRLEVLSGKLIPNLSEEEARQKRICRVSDCQGKYESRGMCQKHRGHYRFLEYIPDKVIGSWEKCTVLIRHKVSKKGVHFLQKIGSSEITCDHSLISLTQDGLEEFKPQERKKLAKIQEINWCFGQIDTIDLEKECKFTEQSPYYSYDEKEIKYAYPNSKNKLTSSKTANICRFITPNILLDFSALLGAFIAEGSTTEGGIKAFRIHNTDMSWLINLEERFNNIFPDIPCKIIQTVKRDKPCFALSCNYEIISRLFSSLCGYQSENKKLPDFVYLLPKEAVITLDKYLVDGDGHREDFGFSYTSKSLALASQYSFLLKLLGLNSNFSYRFNNNRIYYSVRSYLHFETHTCKTWFFEFDYKDEYVYDLEVPTTHNFIDLAGQVLLHNTESLVRQSFKKKEGLMFKEGFGCQGANKETVRYYKTRMHQIAHATNIPTSLLLKRTARSLIRTSNAFIIKKRDETASGGRVRVSQTGKILKPIAGYFPAAPETMRIDLDANTGKTHKWRQVLPDGRYKDFAVEDVIHFTIDRREGFIFGVPSIIPVIDDIRALRQIEENIELLLYQNLFPLFHYKVGTETAPAGYTESGNREVDVIKEQIRLMPSEGAIVTPERHEIKAIGSEGRALRAEGYLTHFKKRVVSGLGVSAVDMGEGDTTNRSTAFTMSRALVDSVKAIQDDLEAQWDQYVINELLLESTFGDNVLDEENMVYLQFAEIDIQNKIEQQKHAIELFQTNGITFDEFRRILAQEPIPVPEDPEDQDPAKYPEWFNTYWKLFEEPLNLIRAVDESYSASSQAAAEARSTALTMKSVKLAAETKQTIEQTKAEEDRKTKIAVSSNRNIQKKDNTVKQAFGELKEELQFYVTKSFALKGIIDKDYIAAVSRIWITDTASKFNSLATAEMLKGFTNQNGFAPVDAKSINIFNAGRNELINRIEFRIDKLATDTISLFHRRIDEHIESVTLNQASLDNNLTIAFDASQYRTNFIWSTELQKAYMYGRVLALRYNNTYGFRLVADSNSCDKCKALNGKIFNALEVDLNDIPPLHPSSRMSIEIIPSGH